MDFKKMKKSCPDGKSPGRAAFFLEKTYSNSKAPVYN